MKGTPDFYRGSILFGDYLGYPKQLSADESGSLIALLKAMYGDIPTPIQCDVDGNINISINATTTPILITQDEYSTPIQTTPPTGQQNHNINIAEQTLPLLNTAETYALAVSEVINDTVLDGEWSTGSSFSQLSKLFRASISISGNNDLRSSLIQLLVNGTTYFLETIDAIISNGVYPFEGAIFLATKQSVDNKAYTITLITPIRCKTNWSFKFYNASGATVSSQGKTGAFTLWAYNRL